MKNRRVGHLKSMRWSVSVIGLDGRDENFQRESWKAGFSGPSAAIKMIVELRTTGCTCQERNKNTK